MLTVNTIFLSQNVIIVLMNNQPLSKAKNIAVENSAAIFFIFYLNVFEYKCS